MAEGEDERLVADVVDTICAAVKAASTRPVLFLSIALSGGLNGAFRFRVPLPLRRARGAVAGAGGGKPCGGGAPAPMVTTF